MIINNITLDYFDIFSKAWISSHYDHLTQISKTLLMLNMNKHRYIDIQLSINSIIDEKEVNISFSLKKNKTFDFVETQYQEHFDDILKNINNLQKIITV